MRIAPSHRVPLLAFGALLLAAVAVRAQAPATAPTPATPPAAVATPAPAAPPSPVSGIRNKLAAGDLLSAESILEVHREKNGEDGAWLSGLGWLARGALLVGDLDKAERYAAEVRTQCVARLAKGDTLARDHDLEGALGASIEVETQRLERTRGRGPAAAHLRKELAAWRAGSTAFQARLHKRLDQLTLEGSPAPELAVEDHLGDAPPSLASLRGRPIVLFLWAEWCGDCKAQAASLGRVLAHHKGDGLACVAVTRFYEDEAAARPREKARVDSVWSAVYSDLGPLPRVFSTASMVEYGVSATPTFVFIDRKGVVRRYTPTRLTEAELERQIVALSR